MHTAEHNLLTSEQEGTGGKKLVCFTSRHSHYTIKRGANMMGLGMNAARYVPVDSRGKMKPSGACEVLRLRVCYGVAMCCLAEVFRA